MPSSRPIDCQLAPSPRRRPPTAITRSRTSEENRFPRPRAILDNSARNNDVSRSMLDPPRQTRASIRSYVTNYQNNAANGTYRATVVVLWASGLSGGGTKSVQIQTIIYAQPCTGCRRISARSAAICSSATSGTRPARRRPASRCRLRRLDARSRGPPVSNRFLSLGFHRGQRPRPHAVPDAPAVVAA